AHWIENSTSSATSSSELCGSDPSSRSKYRSKYVMSGHHPRSRDGFRCDADHRQSPAVEEVCNRSEPVDAVRPVPLPDAVVEPEERSAQQPRVAVGHRAGAHRAREEARPGELELARP